MVCTTLFGEEKEDKKEEISNYMHKQNRTHLSEKEKKQAPREKRVNVGIPLKKKEFSCLELVESLQKSDPHTQPCATSLKKYSYFVTFSLLDPLKRTKLLLSGLLVEKGREKKYQSNKQHSQIFICKPFVFSLVSMNPREFTLKT